MIYLLANANAVSGGPELLHQCCAALNDLGCEAQMIYFDKWKYPVEASDSVLKAYGVYRCPVAKKIEYHETNYVIIGETFQFFLPIFKRMKKIIWWLSVDNFFAAEKSKYAMLYAPFGMRWKRYNMFSSQYIHCCQSEYARLFLAEKGIINNVYMLSDYLSKEFLINTRNEFAKMKKNQIVYNPKKGKEFTQKLIQAKPEFTWIPLQGYTHNEMIEIMMQSKVYIDFGNHPGKDRIPREAVMCGCCIITGKRGSAQNSVDVLIDEKYKFSEGGEDVGAILEKINYCFENYEQCRGDFDNYRERTKHEQEIFNKEVLQLVELISKK